MNVAAQIYWQRDLINAMDRSILSSYLKEYGIMACNMPGFRLSIVAHNFPFDACN